MGKLEGRAAVITGGASGIGAATARLFAEEGCRVLIADVQDEKGERLADELGGKALYLYTDISREANVEAAVGLALEAFGRLDCMFNNAGIPGAVGPIEPVSVEGFDETVGVLLRGVFLGIKHAAPVMRRQGSGSIINTASVAGFRAGYGNHVYSAAKAAVIQLTRSVAMELGEDGVRVNCICPGFIATPMIGRARGLSAEEADGAVEKISSFRGDAAHQAPRAPRGRGEGRPLARQRRLRLCQRPRAGRRRRGHRRADVVRIPERDQEAELRHSPGPELDSSGDEKASAGLTGAAGPKRQKYIVPPPSINRTELRTRKTKARD